MTFQFSLIQSPFYLLYIIIESSKCALIVFICITLLHISAAAIFRETSVRMPAAETRRRVLHIKTISLFRILLVLLYYVTSIPFLPISLYGIMTSLLFTITCTYFFVLKKHLSMTFESPNSE